MSDLQALTEKVHNMEVKQTKVAGDVEHIKTRIDNGVSSTLTNIYKKLEGICPQVIENSYWVGKFKQSLWWIATIGVGGGILGVIWTNITNGTSIK